MPRKNTRPLAKAERRKMLEVLRIKAARLSPQGLRDETRRWKSAREGRIWAAREARGRAICMAEMRRVDDAGWW
jgi:hypothetical protein